MSGGLEAFGTVERARRRAHDPSNPRLVPAIAAGSRDPVVKQLIPVLEKVYTRRHCLRTEYRELGKLLLPAFPELLARPRGDTEYERRRSDGFEAVIRVLLTLAACCNWRTMEILDPQGGYLSVFRLAQLADLPCLLVADDDRNRRFRMDTTERALRALRIARIVCFTKQHREQLEDGSYTTTAPAMRKLSVHFFRKFGGYLSKSFGWLRDEVKKRRGRNDRRQRQHGPGAGADIRVSESLEDIRRPLPSIRPAGPAPVPPPAGPRRSIPPELLAAVATEHPEWPLADMMAEARRRMRELDPPGGGAGAPPENE
jgi:hypothetical protein